MGRESVGGGMREWKGEKGGEVQGFVQPKDKLVMHIYENCVFLLKSAIFLHTMVFIS